MKQMTVYLDACARLAIQHFYKLRSNLAALIPLTAAYLK
jgi:hypothetical protein